MNVEAASHTPDVPESMERLAIPAIVAVLDAGGQYVDLVKKAAERLGYPAEILPLDTPAELIKKQYRAVIISGSPANSQETDAPVPDPAIWGTGLPILGICYGMQAMAAAFGGEVARGVVRQDGRTKTKVTTSHPLFHDTKIEQTALFTHGNFVTKVPDSFEVIGSHVVTIDDDQDSGTELLVHSAIAHGNMVSVQFHPEVFDDTPEGYQIFKNFLGDIAGLEADASLIQDQTEQQINKLRAEIREKVGDKHVIAFVSGGVDSSVATFLAATEIAAGKLHAYYIDNGFMRDEDESVIDLLRHLGVPVTKVDATAHFANATKEEDGRLLGPLGDTTDPQEKRQIIGKAFVDVKNQLLAELGLEEAILLQGTNAADRIESGHSKGGTHTALIKTHHNQVKEIQDLKARGLLLEPLDELFKDEVRTLGRFLGLPPEVVDRHPFPGPGLAIRIICAETIEQKPEIEAKIQTFSKRELREYGDTTRVKLLPVRNVGVGGDERSHVEVVALQSTADRATLSELAVNLPQNFREHINRVVVALGNNSIDDLSVTPTKLRDEVARLQLRQADRIVFEEMRKTGAINDINQCPVVLLPLSFGQEGQRSIVLRPVTTATYLTVQRMLPGRDLSLDFAADTARRIMAEVPSISQVFLDLTGKPPGTTEWE